MTLSYQAGWPNAFHSSEYFDTSFVNLAEHRAKVAAKLIYLLHGNHNIDACICLHSVFSNSCNIRREIKRVLRNASATKVYFLGNEYKLMPEKLDLIREINAKLVFTQSNNYDVINLYKANLPCSVKYMPSCGIDPSIFFCTTKYDDRDIDVGYRSYRSPLYIGNNERAEISTYFSAYCKQHNLSADISLEPKDRFTILEYARFLNRCKFQLGSEAGGDYYEITDETRNKINKYDESQQSDWENIYSVFFKDRKDKLKLRAISGRITEAAACGSVQILFEGDYCGYMQPDKHFISLKKDFSNIKEVQKKMNNLDLIDEIRQNAIDMTLKFFTYNALIKATYEELVKLIEL